MWIQGTLDGRWIRQSAKTKVYEEACLVLADLLKGSKPEKDGESHPVPAPPTNQRITLPEAHKAWLDHYGVEQESTKAKRDRESRPLIQWATNHQLQFLDQTTSPEMVSQFWKEWRLASLKKLKYNTLKSRWALLHAFLRYCVKQEWLVRNPLDSKKIEELKPKKPKPRPGEKLVVGGSTPGLDEEGGDGNWRRVHDGLLPFLAEIRGSRTRNPLILHPENFLALIELMYETGLRVSDATVFNPDLIIDTERGATYENYQMKNGKPVTAIFTNPELVEKLRRLPRLSTVYPFFNGARSCENYITANIRVPLRKLGKRVGVHLHPHRFRDSFAGNELDGGADIRDVSLQLGHSSVTITEKHYARFCKKAKDAMEARVHANRAAREARQAKVVEIKQKVG